MQIEMADPATLVPHPQNSRKHSDRQIRQLAKAMQEFGFTQPIVVGKTHILAGHARREAAIEAGLATVPVIRRTDLTEAQERALVLADNRMHDLGGYDVKLLDAEARDLMAMGIDLNLMGMSLDAPLASFREEPDEDDVPEEPDEPMSQPGDVWHLGPHRVFVGDSRDPSIIAQAMAMKPTLMATDPPYGVNYDPSWRNKATGATGAAAGKVQNDHEADWRDVWALFEGNVAFVWHAGTMAHIVAESLQAADFAVNANIIWDKCRPILSRGHYHPAHEACFLAVRNGKKLLWNGPGLPSVWKITHRKNGSGHGTQKPVECMRRPMQIASRAGDVVFDPFLGSGTSVIAAQSCGRVCVGCEIDLRYADVIALRWQAYVGGSAEVKLMRGGIDVLAKGKPAPSKLQEAGE